MKPELQPDELMTLYAASIVEEMSRNPPDTEEEFCALLDARKVELYTEIQKLMGEPH